ncbi:MAG TPA: hypothetical protein VGQ52_01665 [Gemmatimonadaceae bacterium]|nr:hypothetical protein [Gemmatimonadaceae bacterium]
MRSRALFATAVVLFAATTAHGVLQAGAGRVLRRVVTPEYMPTFVYWVMERATRRK